MLPTVAVIIALARDVIVKIITVVLTKKLDFLFSGAEGFHFFSRLLPLYTTVSMKAKRQPT